MEYRFLPHGGEKIGVIGMGSSVIGAKPEEEIIATVRGAMERGVNFFDMAGGHAAIFEAYGKALEGRREKAYLQVHFGADYTSGEYGWTTKLAEVKASVKWQLEKLRTDYIDFGFIHCLDEEKDLADYRKNGVLDYVQEMKARGVVRHIGLSSHTPVLVNRVLDMGIVDIADVLRQSCVRLWSGRFRYRLQRRPAGALPPLRNRGRGHFGDEAVLRRTAARRGALALQSGADKIPVPAICAG